MTRADRAARRLLACACAALLAGCGTTAEFEKPTVAIPETWLAPADPSATIADRPWAGMLPDRLLDALIREALANNADLRIAAERVELARAQFGLQRSVMYPQVGVSGSVLRQRSPSFSSGTENTVSESASLGLAVATWEIDLWGRLRAATEAARRQLLANEGIRRAAYASLVAQVAQAYISLLDLDAELLLSQQTAASRRESARLVNARYRGGVASRLDLSQATSLVGQADSAIAVSEQRRSQTENALAILVGRNPGPIARAATLRDLPLPPSVPAGLPSDLLTRRYDILAAEESLRAADASVDAARKAFLPTITLTGLLGFASPALRDLLDGGRYAWSAGAGLSLPVFTAGQLTSNLEAAQAQQRIAVEQYKVTIRTAFREVDDALVSYQRLAEQRAAVVVVVDATREQLRLNELRYRAGVDSYANVLTSAQQLFDAELQLIQVTSAQYTSVVQLYRSLGGGWDPAAAIQDFPRSPSDPRRPGLGWSER